MIYFLNKGISFPMEGYTLTIDFPVNQKNLNLLNILDKITLKNNGRFYLAKDSRMSPKTFLVSDKRINSFKEFRLKNNKIKFHSKQSRRLGI